MERPPVCVARGPEPLEIGLAAPVLGRGRIDRRLEEDVTRGDVLRDAVDVAVRALRTDVEAVPDREPDDGR